MNYPQNILFLIALATLIFSSSVVSAQDQTAQFDEIVNDFYDDGPGYSIVITKEGNTIYESAIGQANLELDIPLQTDHIFRIGSITKQITASAILQLEEAGKLSLQDDLTKFYPEYPTDGKTITVEHLLTHTSGIRSYTGMEKWDSEVRKQDFTLEGLVDFFKDEPMDFAPGEQFRYNNSGYILLGYIIEKASGMTYEDYIEQKVFAPLGMKDSYYGQPSEILPRRVPGYGQNQDGYQNAEYLSMTQPYAAGSLLMTTGDLAIWNEAVFTDKVISAENRKKAHTPYILNNGESAGYGYGWSFANLKGKPVITHGGGINGFSTASGYIPEDKIFIAVFTNCTCNNPDLLMQRLGMAAIGQPYVKPQRIEVAEEDLKKYLGEYELAPGFTVVITLNEGKLMATPTGQGTVEIVPISEHRFSIEVVSAEVLFNPGEDGKIESMTLFQGGEHLAKKIK